MSAIRLRGLSKTFRKGFWMKPMHALRGVDLSVREGEIFGFLGPNGAGKTTTIKILTGLIHPSAGEAWIGDLPVEVPESRKKLGFLPEGTFFHDHLTGLEFCEMHARLLGIPRAERRDRIRDLMVRVGLADSEAKQIRHYSKGMRQRVGLAQALLGDPEVVILDEPMSGLDPVGRREVRDLILELREQGRTVFFSSHVLADAEMICDQVAVIVAGRVVETGYLADLLGRQMGGVELVVEGLSEERWQELSRASRRSVGHGMRHLFEFSDEDTVEKALDEVRRDGGRIVSLVPARRSLEDLVVERSRSVGMR
ncbi:ABC transporter ATP-binding protein [Myxococcota bacterium]|nr:ABC transporter ATP-binding protein [Myxococcota bacterium]